MSRVAAIGEGAQIACYALAGVELLPAEDVAEALSSWERVRDDVGLLLLTPMAEEAIEERTPERPELLRARLP